jgi:hypothetical protein
VRRNIPSNIAADVSPWKGSTPVVISYKTIPNENKSLRASNGFPSACSGDITGEEIPV